MTNLTVVTAYCICKLCCGEHASGITASGVVPKAGVTIAASRKIPFGTRIWIEGHGTRIVQDRLSKKYDSRIDIFMDSHAQAKKFGIQKLKTHNEKETNTNQRD